MSDVIFDKWLWITIVSIFLIITVPLIVVWFILWLPMEFRLIATILIIVLWGVVAGYKEWATSRHNEEEQDRT